MSDNEVVNPDIPMETVCETCGKSYGEHVGINCDWPTDERKRKFKAKPKPKPDTSAKRLLRVQVGHPENDRTKVAVMFQFTSSFILMQPDKIVGAMFEPGVSAERVRQALLNMAENVQKYLDEPPREKPADAPTKLVLPAGAKVGPDPGADEPKLH